MQMTLPFLGLTSATLPIATSSLSAMMVDGNSMADHGMLPFCSSRAFHMLLQTQHQMFGIPHTKINTLLNHHTILTLMKV